MSDSCQRDQAPNGYLDVVPRYVTHLKWKATCCCEVQKEEFRVGAGPGQRSPRPCEAPDQSLSLPPDPPLLDSLLSKGTVPPPGIIWAGRPSAAQVALPPLSSAQLARPVLCPSLRSPRDFLFACVLHKMFQCPCQRVRAEGKPCVILPHAIDIHTLPCL